MLFSQYDSQTTAKLNRAFDDAWHELEETAIPSADDFSSPQTPHARCRQWRTRPGAAESTGDARHGTMALPKDEQAIDYRSHPSRERLWLIGLLLTAVIFLAMAGFVLMSDLPPPSA